MRTFRMSNPRVPYSQRAFLRALGADGHIITSLQSNAACLYNLVDRNAVYVIKYRSYEHGSEYHVYSTTGGPPYTVYCYDDEDTALICARMMVCRS